MPAVESELSVDHQVSLFSLQGGAELAARICGHLGIEPGRTKSATSKTASVR